MTIEPVKRPWKCAAAGSGLMAILAALVVSTGCIREGWADTASMSTVSSIPAVVTADIQAGIERHIEEQMRVGGGYYRLQFKDRELRLKLVRVHTEYLRTSARVGISRVWIWRMLAGTCMTLISSCRATPAL